MQKYINLALIEEKRFKLGTSSIFQLWISFKVLMKKVLHLKILILGKTNEF